jgi:hypothetical protein
MPAIIVLIAVHRAAHEKMVDIVRSLLIDMQKGSYRQVLGPSPFQIVK